MGKNISQPALLFQEALALKQGFKFSVMELSSAISQYLSATIGFKTIKTMYYEDVIKPSNGGKLDLDKLPKGLFRTEKPNLKFMIKKLAHDNARL